MKRSTSATRIASSSWPATASAILIDANMDDGVIQLETKPYKAPATSSWALEIEAGTDFFETMREAYHAVVEDGKEV
jgi:hypothetical protein